jgi:hypothetical protein
VVRPPEFEDRHVHEDIPESVLALRQ